MKRPNQHAGKPTALANIAKRREQDVAPADGLSLFDGRWFGGVPSTCRWPLNETTPIDLFRMCGAPVAPGCGSYCAEHDWRSRRGCGGDDVVEAAE